MASAAHDSMPKEAVGWARPAEEITLPWNALLDFEVNIQDDFNERAHEGAIINTDAINKVNSVN